MPPSTALDRATAVARAASALAGHGHDALAPDEAVLVVAEIARAKAMLDAALLAVTARLDETQAAQARGWAARSTPPAARSASTAPEPPTNAAPITPASWRSLPTTSAA